MNGCAKSLLVIKFGIIALAIQDFRLNFDDIIVYAKPGDAMELSKIDAIDNEDLAINCGKTRRIWLSTPHKISIGSAAKLGQFPWAIALTFQNIKQYNYCGGSIISKRHILTAAHCVMHFESSHLPCITGASRDNINEIAVRYGGICLRNDSPPCGGKLCATAGIRKVAFHRRYVDEGCIHGYDFAIIELETDLMFDTSTSAICLPNSTFDLNFAENLFDFGFGENEKGEIMSRLNYGSAKILGVTKHRDFIRAGPIYKPKNMTRHHGICAGDSGAGLQGSMKHRAFLLGIHSFSSMNCSDGIPFTVTDARRYAQLICHLTGICYHLSSWI